MDRTNANTALASVFAEELARCGVRHAVISPGSRSTPLAVALWRESGIETDVIVDERGAAFYALGAAQATGSPVAILCTSGSAAANYHPAVIEADEAGVPLIVLTADRPPELRGIGAGQAIDQLKLYGGSVRWFSDVGTHAADDAGLLHYRATACRAFAAAAGDPRPGPVHLNLSWREPLSPVAELDAVTATDPLAVEGRAGDPLTRVSAEVLSPTAAQLEEIAADIAGAERGLIVCGRDPDPGRAVLISELASRAGYPILAEPTSQLRMGPHDRSLVVSTYDSIARVRPDALEPGFVLRFGDMPTSKPLRQWLASLPGTRVVTVDPRFGWNEPSRKAAEILRADPALVAAGLAAALDESRSGDWLAGWISADAAVLAAHEEQLGRFGGLTEPGLHDALGGIHADGDLVYTASSMPIRDQEEFLRTGTGDVQFLSNRGANGIDGLLSSGIGAAYGTRRPTTIILGDVGLLHDVGALAALTPEDPLPIRIVVIDNGGGGIFHFLPQFQDMEREEFEALLGTPTEIDPGAAAELFGIEHRGLGSLAELPDAMAAEGPVLISASVDRDANVEIHQRLREAAAAALRAL